MTDGVGFAFRFLMVTWASVTLLIVAGCGSSASDAVESTASEVVTIDRVHAVLVADVDRVVPGETFQVGVFFTIPDGSHIYWRNPGSSGLPTGVEWTLPEGAEVGKLQWPTPKRFEVEGWDEVSFGYESEVLLFTEVRIAASTSDAQSLSLEARVYWLNCEEDGQCIPGEANIQLEVPVGSESKPSTHESLFEQSRVRVPFLPRAGSLPVLIGRTEGEASFLLVERDGVRILPDGADGPDFFPYEGEAWKWTHDSIKLKESYGAPDLQRERIAESFYFDPPVDSASSGGVLVFSVEREDSGTRQTFYISMEE